MEEQSPKLLKINFGKLRKSASDKSSVAGPDMHYGIADIVNALPVAPNKHPKTDGDDYDSRHTYSDN